MALTAVIYVERPGSRSKEWPQKPRKAKVRHLSPKERSHDLRADLRDALPAFAIDDPGAKRWEHLPRRLEHLENAILASRALLSREDEDGLPLCSAETWERAMNFLAEQALWLLNQRGRVMQTPDIWSGPDQSIDLHWETPSYELLINVRADPAQLVGFYGDDKGKLKIKGTLDPARFNEGLLLWLERSGDDVV